MTRPGILVLCSTRRGIAFVRRLIELRPDARLCVCSFPGAPWEPPYLEELRDWCLSAGHFFVQAASPLPRDLPEGFSCDLLFAVNWRHLTEGSLGALPSRGAFVFHDSLLPRYRGFSPSVWAVVNGEIESGVTLFEMSPAMDSGPIVDQQAFPIGPQDNIGVICSRATDAYLALLSRHFNALLAGKAPRREQDESLATYACRRLPADNRVDWRLPAGRIHNLIRGTTRPYPGAFCRFHEHTLRIWSADLPDQTRTWAGTIPGRVVERLHGRGVRVLAGSGSLVLREVQIDNESPAPAHNIIRSLSDTLE